MSELVKFAAEHPYMFAAIVISTAVMLLAWALTHNAPDDER